ncbi:TrmH family RNA methyltransferase [Streptomyces sp. NPDC018019]|uniref:TrmH family RNA methyltransferase n=1 Tax=Streptomyces sp. NPDC018019 TaxID=3365030 RepID=UPI00379E7EC9
MSTYIIDSIKDPRIAEARTLLTRAGRLAAGLCLLEGASLIGQALAGGARLRYVLRAADASESGLEAGLAAAGVPVHPVRSGLLPKAVGGSKPVSWVALAELPAEVAPDGEWSDFALVCEGIADPGNLGTLVRSAQALGVRDVVLTDEQTDLGSRRTLDSARGAVLTSRVRRFATPAAAVKQLKESGFQVVATSPRGSHLQAMAPLRGGPVALVIGNETAGVSDETLDAADLIVQIPMAGGVESLNVGVAAGISIYELRTKMILTMLTEHIRGTLGRELNVTARLVRSALDAELSKIGDLDGRQMVALMVVACERSTPLTELHRDLGAGSEEELGQVLRPLRDRGYLEAAGPDAVSITGAGEQALASMWSCQERVEAELHAGLSPDERDQLHAMLRRVQANASRLCGGPEQP